MRETEAILSFNLLGSFEAFRNGVPIPDEDWKRKKTQSLLKILLSERGRAFSSDQLIDLLFPDLEPDKAARNLRARISELRRALEPELEKGTESRFILKQGEGYAFPTECSAVLDTEKYAALREKGHELQRTERWSQALEVYQKASELFRGDFLAEALYEDWTQSLRERWKDEQVSSLTNQAECQARQGVFAKAIELISAALNLKPFDERSVRHKMLYHYYADEPGKALKVFENYSILLNEELESEPSSEAAELRDLIYRGKIPPIAKETLNNIPQPTTPFVGRHDELQTIRKWIETDQSRLLTILGPGGIGKSRLALRAAAQALSQERVEDGIYFVGLASIDSADSIISAIAQALQFSFYGKEEPSTQLLSYLNSKRLLLILDNFEHVLSGVAFVSDILKSAADTKIIVTSRERLNISGESLLNLSGLEAPLPDVLNEMPIHEATQFPAIDLFLETAGRIKKDFETVDENLQPIVEICELVDGSPLGIELAASWIRSLELVEISNEIKKNLRFLESRLQDVPERHRSMHAVFEYSWNLLSETERKILCSLSSFRGGFAREAVEETFSISLAQLVDLQDKSLVQKSESDRFSMHELIRQFAEMRLQESPQQMSTMLEAHGIYYTSFLKNREREVEGPNQIETLEEIETEIDNIRAAWIWAIENSKELEIQNALHVLAIFYEVRGLLKEAVEVFTNARSDLATIPESPSSRELIGHILIKIGRFTCQLGLTSNAEEALQQSHDIFKSLDDKSGLAIWNDYYGLLAHYYGEFQNAQMHYESAIDYYDSQGKLASSGSALNRLGFAMHMQGDYEQAKILYEKSMSIPQEFQSPMLKAKNLNNLGLVSYALGKNEQAKSQYRESMEIYQKIQFKWGLLSCYNNLGLVLDAEKDFESARAHYRVGIELAKETGQKTVLAGLLNNLGLVEANSGDWKAAYPLLKKSLALKYELGDQRGIANSLTNLSEVAFNLGESDESHGFLLEALELSLKYQALPTLLSGLGTVSAHRPTEHRDVFAASLLQFAIEHPSTEHHVKEQGKEHFRKLYTHISQTELSEELERLNQMTLDEIVAEVLEKESD